MGGLGTKNWKENKPDKGELFNKSLPYTPPISSFRCYLIASKRM